MPLNYPHSVPTMISNEEKEYLYKLTSHDWVGKGIVVEIGPWLGGSTYCLAAGLRDSKYVGQSKLFVFDNFVWREFMSPRSGLHLKDGESFYGEFKKNTQELSMYINSFEASLPDEMVSHDTYADQRRQKAGENKGLIKNVTKEPVEIIFIDGAKSWTGMKYLISEFYPFLIPNSSILVCQDYKHWGMYWVVMIIELLSDKLELRDILKSNTVSFKLVASFNKTDIEKIPDFEDVKVETGLALIRSAADRLTKHGDFLGARIVQLTAIRFLVHKNQMNEAIGELCMIETAWPLRMVDSPLEKTKTWLCEQSGSHIPDTSKTKLRRMLLKVRKRLKRLGF